MKVLISFCKPYLRSFVCVFGLNVLIGCTELALPYLLIQIINGASAVHAGGGAGIYANLWTYVFLLGAGILFKYWNQNTVNQSSLLIVPVSLWLSHRTVTSISAVSRELSDQIVP